MHLHNRMISKFKSGARSHKGYHNVPIFHSSPASRHRVQINPPSSPSVEIAIDPAGSPSDSNQKWAACPWILLGVAIFFIFLIVIYNNMPDPESSVPLEDLSFHDNARPMNPIISPRFRVDPSITERIPQMDVIQLMEQTESISNDKGSTIKRAIVYMLQPGASNGDFCDLLLSLTSAIRGTTSSPPTPPTDIDFLLFYSPHSFHPESLDLESMANKLR